MDNQRSISIIVPALNEAGNIPQLVQRIHDTLTVAQIRYEIILIDDHSTDETVSVAEKFSTFYPVVCYLKQGFRGKAYSLIEGFGYAKYPLLAILDADLQYPPEALPGMIQKIVGGADVVVANRVSRDESILRTVISRSFNFVFARLLHGLNCDVQSGMKVFRKEILRDVTLNPTPWTFDMEFLIEARQRAYTIDTVVIPFAERLEGQSKINIFRASYEIGSNALQLKFKRRKPRHTAPIQDASMIGAGVKHKGKHFITHSTLHHSYSAIETFAPWQQRFSIAAIALFVIGIVFAPLGTTQFVIAVLSVIYFIDVVFNLFLVRRSLHTPPEIHYTDEELRQIDISSLPVYSILCPLYKEAHILPGFLDAIAKLDWPKEKLDVLLLLEENDPDTIAAAHSMALPEYVRVVVVPHSMPKTKPKACNYGLSMARGEYLVVYDAEDIPDPLQLKKAYLGFQNVGPEVKCLQAKLNYFNPRQNLLTRLFTAEYSLWFDVILTGLQSLNTYIPLGGTSNHFRTNDLRNLAGWDPFNVTEDCDLGIRLFKVGYKTAVIDSTTLEEANSDFKNWLRQRSRWIKGYMQTYLVHMRRPVQFSKESKHHSLIFQLVVGGKIAFALINPILWITTILYFTFRSIIGPSIEALYPPFVFTMAGMSLIFGNFLCLYYYMVGCAKREQWGLIKYVYLVPLYWLATSIAAYIALYELIVKPHYWQKTNHGLQKAQPVLANGAPVLAVPRRSLRASVVRLIPARLREQVGTSGGMLISVMMISNFINLLFNAYLGRELNFEDFGVLTLVNTLWYLGSVFINGVTSTINEQTAFLVAKGDTASSNRLLHGVRSKVIIIALAVSVVWVFAVRSVAAFFNIADSESLFLFTPLFTVGLLAATNRGYLNGTFAFRSLSRIMLIETISKMGLAFLFVKAGMGENAYLAIPISVSIAAVLTFIATPKVQMTSPAQSAGFPPSFYIAAIASSLSSVVFLSLDILLVKHFLDPVSAGEYSLLSLVGKMLYFFGSLPVVFMIPLVRRLEGLGKRTEWVFQTIFLISLVLVSSGYLFLGPFGPFIIPFIFGHKAASIAPLLSTYVGALALFTLSTIVVSYHLAKKNYIFPVVSLILSMCMALGIWTWHRDITQVVQVLFIVSSFGLSFFLILHFALQHLKSLRNNIRDFIDVFLSIPECAPKLPGTKRILIFNWRDTRHVFAGGAEVYVHEIAKQWVAAGHQVMQFSGNDGMSPRNETIDGVHIIRRGGFYFVYFWAAVYYVLRLRKCDFDVLIDSQNGIPFFTPLYTRRPVYCLMHHVHQEVFTRSLAKPLAWFARFLEKDLMPLVYRGVPFITVSESSKADIEALGLGHAGIEVVHPGVDLRELAPGVKHSVPMVLYLGRLKAYKSIDVLIRAFARVLLRIPDAQLVIAGSGEEEKSLKQLVSELELEDQVTFAGKVSEPEKVSLLQRAWLFVNPSFMEGWGITTIEANACATPVVASNVPGLRDSVRNPHTGYLVEHGNVEKFAERMIDILGDTALRQRMSVEAMAWANRFDWTNSSKRFLEIINEHAEG